MHHHRRRKKRPTNYEAKQFNINRGPNGFGFTISGQQPCILSCIVQESQADLAGLKAGDCVISVNNLNVTNLPHEVVAQLICTSVGTLRLTVTENFCSEDSSSDDEHVQWLNEKRIYPKYNLKLKNKQQLATTNVSGGGGGGGILSSSSTTTSSSVTTASSAITAAAAAVTVAVTAPIGTTTIIPQTPNIVQSIENSIDKLKKTPEKILSYSSIASVALFSTNPPLPSVTQQSITQPAVILPLSSSSSSSLSSHTIIKSPLASDRMDINNVSAMVRSTSPPQSSTTPTTTLSIKSIPLMTTTPQQPPSMSIPMPLHLPQCSIQEHRDYGVIVDYFGTVQIPSIISQNSILQNIRRSIRKIRQEKRIPTSVLITILPTILTVQNGFNQIIAKYPRSSLSYISSSLGNDNRFFGLVTTTTFVPSSSSSSTSPPPPPPPPPPPTTTLFPSSIQISQQQQQQQHISGTESSSSAVSSTSNHHIQSLFASAPSVASHHHNHHHSQSTTTSPDVIISNNCHVFAIDTKLVSHSVHFDKAKQFQLNCTIDPATNLCLEFPNNSEYIVDLIRNIYTLKSVDSILNSPVAKHRKNYDGGGGSGGSSQCLLSTTSTSHSSPTTMSPSSRPISIRSEITTTSSNSDSGIGFYDQPYNNSNIDEKILFSTTVTSNTNMASNATTTISNKNLSHSTNRYDQQQYSVESIQNTNNNYNKNLKQSVTCTERIIPILKPTYTKSKSMELLPLLTNDQQQQHRPTDLPTQKFDKINKIDESIKRNIGTYQHVFLQPKPPPPPQQQQQQQQQQHYNHHQFHQLTNENLMSYKLCPKVYNVSLATTMNTQSTLLTGGNSANRLENLSNTTKLTTQNVESDFYLSNNSKTYFNDTNINSIDGDRNGSLSVSSYHNNHHHEYNHHNNNHHHQSYMKSTHSEPDLSPMEYENKDLNEKTSNESSNNKKITTWGYSFEKLLDDPFGLRIFAEFLKKEFSAENIYFWTACERYRKLDDGTDRQSEALIIFGKHLATGASEPVNVDSQARIKVESQLKNAELHLFRPAQNQVFNLMKFDSYQRFIRSELYKSSLECEKSGNPLPYSNEPFDKGLRTDYNQSSTLSLSSSSFSSSSTTTTGTAGSKLKKSLSNAEDGRRKSLLPWHRKIRCKSKDRDETNSIKSSTSSVLKCDLQHQALLNPDIHSSRSSLSSLDAAISSRRQHQKDCSGSGGGVGGGTVSTGPGVRNSALCRIILNDGSTTIVQTSSTENIRNLIQRLLEKRGIYYNGFEAFLAESPKSLDLDTPSIQLAGKEVIIEQRVIFKIDLPNSKIISVKSKTCKALGEVLRPILNKYHFRLDSVDVFIKHNRETLNLEQSVSECDGQRLLVVMSKENTVPQAPIPSARSQFYGNHIDNSTTNCNNIVAPNLNINDNDSDSNRPKFLANFFNIKYNKENSNSSNTSCGGGGGGVSGIISGVATSGENRNESSSLLAITNTNTNPTEHQQYQHTGATNTTTATQPSAAAAASSSSSSSTTNNYILKKPPKLKIPAPRTKSTTENQDLLEGLNRAQRARLEDQRGTEINFELPDFLKDKENNEIHGGSISSLDDTLDDNQKLLITTNRGGQQRNNNKIIDNYPEPAPRLSIMRDSSLLQAAAAASASSSSSTFDYANSKKHENDNNILITTSTKQAAAAAATVAPSATAAIATSTLTTTPSILLVNNINNNKTCSVFNNNSNYSNNKNGITCPPPPLPPKPKILPIKPSNWGQTQQQTQSSPPTAKFNSDDDITTTNLS